MFITILICIFILIIFICNSHHFSKYSPNNSQFEIDMQSNQNHFLIQRQQMVSEQIKKRGLTSSQRRRRGIPKKSRGSSFNQRP